MQLLPYSIIEELTSKNNLLQQEVKHIENMHRKRAIERDMQIHQLQDALIADKREKEQIIKLKKLDKSNQKFKVTTLIVTQIFLIASCHAVIYETIL